jgi:carboxymethylenebutenolidase
VRHIAPALLLSLMLTPAVAGAADKNAAKLPPDENTARQRLDSTPRHGEYVDVKAADGTAIRTFVVYPERKDKAGVVVIIHEIFGLSDWIRGVADQLAAEGFIAVAPDLVSGLGPNGGGTESAASRDSVVAMVRMLTPDLYDARFAAVRDYALKIPAANGKFATIGFCWGGGKSFLAAAGSPTPAASIVYYGVSPDSATLPMVKAPGALRRRRRACRRHDSSGADRAQGAQAHVRRAHLRRRGARLPAPAGWPRRGEPEGHRTGVATDDRVPEEVSEVARREDALGVSA